MARDAHPQDEPMGPTWRLQLQRFVVCGVCLDGVIGAAIATGVDIAYGIKMKNMEKTIDALNNKLKAENKELQDDKAIVAELTNVKMDIQSVIDLIQPAIEAIYEMIGVWDAIANDLSTIQKYVNKDVRSVSAALTPLVGNVIVTMDKYRKAAYRSDMPNVTTLDEYAKELAKKVKSK
ncbi:hypothetical protein C8J57DRAFT_1494020 [Mycena rebaudengoi]|nr:hypothetical protein C8J57DRAFT_1494020 [Mycena rebaudengoi]